MTDLLNSDLLRENGRIIVFLIQSTFPFSPLAQTFEVSTASFAPIRTKISKVSKWKSSGDYTEG
ncbi:hypothetical protein [Candidatus Leptofilum sp.]|uniref:hypothetical protein n=1 Tax=Candidatus Leptofilum sp. TaxID=3241576 RepID=UPI003B5C69DF